MAEIKYTLTKEDEDLMIKELLNRRLHFSSRLFKKIKVEGDIRLNGVHKTARAKGFEGDILTVVYPDEESYFEPQNIPVDIVYEDDDLLIANKPAGLIVHPTTNFPDGTLANAISWHIKERGDKYKLRFVNRLDMNTSGLVIVAKNAHCQDFISKEMDANRVTKIYLALLCGNLEGEGTVDLPIGKDPNHVARRMVSAKGFPSVTHYKALKHFDGYTLAEIKLDTGRTHQIRVHMSHIGHPVAGDDLYCPVCGINPPYPINHQALHATHLEFIHPVTGKIIKADAPMPSDMEHLIESLSEI